ncbi:MAG: hypothetical protein IIC74_10045, partial [Bacteroidetes bacterium]|nr:hypothetical protein [Bacteroidota bacterium]
FQAIPTNPLNGGIATIPYDEAEQLGYTKFDFLNNSVYEGVKNEKHLIELRDREPPWEYLEEKLIANNLAHVNSDAKFALVKKMKPKSVEELAIVIFRNDTDDDRVQKRMEICKEIFTKYTSTIIEVHSKGNSSLEKALYLIHLGDWVSWFLSELNKVDAMEIDVINHLKSELAKV